MSVPDAKRLKELETENVRLKKLLAERVLQMVGQGLSERRSLMIVGMSASA
jgi:putative transposase